MSYATTLEHHDAMSASQRMLAGLAPVAPSAAVMLVLEDAANAELISDCLREYGYSNVFIAEEPAAAHQKLLNDLPDLLLVDVALPGSNGLDLLQWVRSEKLLNGTAVIVLGDGADMEVKLRALELGAADFLPKPVHARELALRMRNMMTRRGTRSVHVDQDALTGLTNRQRFNIILDWAITYAKRTGVIGAVLQIGVDRFAQVNEALGPTVGDRLLQEVAKRLSTYVRETDVVSTAPDQGPGGDVGVSVSRIGGDEFSVLLPVIQRPEQAALVASRIRNAMSEPFQVAGNVLIVTCSIGIAVFPSDGMTRDTVIRNAGAAMAHAKQQGRDRHEFYGKEMNHRSLARLALERDLRLALERNEFSLVYQPKVAVRAGRLTGAETLLRWRHPIQGMVSPAEFIPVAEEIDLINPLGEWVLRNACRQIQAWKAAGLPTPRISVNVSARQLHDPHFEQSVCSVLAECQVAGANIVLELTESALVQDPDRTAAILKSLRGHGIGLSIDDFGTGYSSLAYLRRFPLDELKIDRSFLLEANEGSTTIASAIIALGHSLQLRVVAEGVEHERQLEFLRAQNCDEYQGYYFSKPIPADAFESLLRGGGARRP